MIKIFGYMLALLTLGVGLLHADYQSVSGGKSVVNGPVILAKGQSAVANNVAIVGTNLGGAGGTSVASVAFSFAGASVTSGNTVLCGASTFGGHQPLTAAMLTKTSGTSTVGTIAIDQQLGNGTDLINGLYRVPITGTGTVTLTFNDTVTGFKIIGCAEFSGVNATPLSTTKGTATGTGAAHSTGSIVSTDLGVMMYVDYEVNNANFTRTNSDVTIFKVDTAGSTYTAIIQYKIINSSPNTMTDTTGSDASTSWGISYALYKTT